MANSPAITAAMADVEAAELGFSYARLAMVPRGVSRALQTTAGANADYSTAMIDVAQQLAVDSRGDPNAAAIAKLAIDAMSINTGARAGHEGHGRFMQAMQTFTAADARLETLKATERTSIKVGGADVLASVTPGLVTTTTPITVTPQAKPAGQVKQPPKKGFPGPTQ